MRATEQIVRFRMSMDDPLAIHRWAVGVGCVGAMILAVVAGMGQQFVERMEVIYDTEMPDDSTFGPVSLGLIAIVFVITCLLNGTTYLIRNRETAAWASIAVGVTSVWLLGRWAWIFGGGMIRMLAPFSVMQ